jgi:hypothetical protein
LNFLVKIKASVGYVEEKEEGEGRLMNAYITRAVS